MDLKDIGRRIKEARENLTPKLSRDDLAKRLNKKDGEIVRLWELGRSPPPLEAIQGLAVELQETEEFLLFGIKRGDQLRTERPVLQWVYPAEVELLTQCRKANQAGQQSILVAAREIAKANPAESASILPIKKKK